MSMWFRRPYGTRCFGAVFPPVNWRAIVGGPYGTGQRLKPLVLELVNGRTEIVP
jgi:hypothetical protein